MAEKWLFRALLVTAGGVVLALLLGSTHEIKRYVRIARM